MTPTKPAPLTKNAGPTPTWAMRTPATAGPTIRAALKAAEFSATARPPASSPALAPGAGRRKSGGNRGDRARAARGETASYAATRAVAFMRAYSTVARAALAFANAQGYARRHSPHFEASGGDDGAPSHVGGQPHGPHLSSARHLHLAHGGDVGRHGAARRRA